jgi:peptidoglycan/LPS O-acetylase OafA/YrhL
MRGERILLAVHSYALETWRGDVGRKASPWLTLVGRVLLGLESLFWFGLGLAAEGVRIGDLLHASGTGAGLGILGVALIALAVLGAWAAVAMGHAWRWPRRLAIVLAVLGLGAGMVTVASDQASSYVDPLTGTMVATGAGSGLLIIAVNAAILLTLEVLPEPRSLRAAIGSLLLVAVVVGFGAYAWGQQNPTVHVASGEAYSNGGDMVVGGSVIDGEAALRVDGTTYGIVGGSVLMWQDSGGGWHQGGWPDCLSPAGMHHIRVGWVTVTASGISWPEIVWVSCDPLGG